MFTLPDRETVSAYGAAGALDTATGSTEAPTWWKKTPCYRANWPLLDDEQGADPEGPHSCETHLLI